MWYQSASQATTTIDIRHIVGQNSWDYDKLWYVGVIYKGSEDKNVYTEGILFIFHERAYKLSLISGGI